MVVASPPPKNREPTTGELLRTALDEGRDLATSELALARKELAEAARAGLVAAVSSAVAAAFGLWAITLLLIGALLALRVKLAEGFFAAGALVAVAAATAGFMGFRSLPKRPMAKTIDRLEGNARDLKGHLT
jgi:hypothetical protein